MPQRKDDVLQMIILMATINVAFCVLLALNWTLSRAQVPRPARALAANYWLYALQGTLLILVLSQGQLGQVRATTAMLLGPALWAFVRAVLTTDSTPSKAYWGWHLLPALAVATLLARGFGQWVDAAILASFAGYWLAILAVYRRGPWPRESLGEFNQPARFSVRALLGLLAIALVSEAMIAAELSDGKAIADSDSLLAAQLLFVVVNGVTLFACLRRWPAMNWLDELHLFVPDSSAKATAGDSFDDAAMRALLARWQQLLSDEPEWRASGMTVARTGRRLGVPARQLSQAINQLHGKSFSQYLNQQRVATVVKLLSQEPPQPLTAIMLDAGFHSKSHFNKEFLRQMGVSPSEYRNSLVHNQNTGANDVV